jgi:hypothetical protein
MAVSLIKIINHPDNAGHHRQVAHFHFLEQVRNGRTIFISIFIYILYSMLVSSHDTHICSKLDRL